MFFLILSIYMRHRAISLGEALGGVGVFSQGFQKRPWFSAENIGEEAPPQYKSYKR